MPFDAEGILRGLYASALVPMDENDVAAVALAANSDGNCVVDVRKTGAKGLAAVMVMLGASSVELAALYNNDTAVVTIEASDTLEGAWEEVARFPVIRAHLLELYVTATVAFVPADIGQLVTQETTADTGYLVSYEPALNTIGGTGKIVVAPVDSGDVFNEAAGKTINSAGTGESTKTYGAGTTVSLPEMTPGIYVVRFTTNKRYVRANCEAVADSFGNVWILLTDSAFNKL